MKYLKTFNQQYSNLCAIYGDLMLKKQQLDAEIEQTLNKINNLQQSQPQLAQLEQQLTKESNSEQETTNQTKNS